LARFQTTSPPCTKNSLANSPVLPSRGTIAHTTDTFLSLQVALALAPFPTTTMMMMMTMGKRVRLHRLLCGCRKVRPMQLKTQARPRQGAQTRAVVLQSDVLSPLMQAICTTDDSHCRRLLLVGPSTEDQRRGRRGAWIASHWAGRARLRTRSAGAWTGSTSLTNQSALLGALVRQRRCAAPSQTNTALTCLFLFLFLVR
jgi:hypothetical protein